MAEKRAKPLILHIDDSDDIITYTATLLKSWGMEPISAMKGDEGLKLAETKIPDLILMDVQMPDLDGHRACWILKQNPKTKHIPILMLTVQDEVKQVDKAVKFGASGYALKPIQKDRLKEKIQELLKDRPLK